MKQLKRRVSSLQDEINLLQKTNAELMGIQSEYKAVVRRTIEKMAKNFPTYFFRMSIYTKRATLKWCTGETSERNHFRGH